LIVFDLEKWEAKGEKRWFLYGWFWGHDNSCIFLISKDGENYTYENWYFGLANTKPPIGSLWFPFAKYGKMEKNQEPASKQQTFANKVRIYTSEYHFLFLYHIIISLRPGVGFTAEKTTATCISWHGWWWYSAITI
jgi:hypothetical protein